MKTFSTVEDYIEVISGCRDTITGQLTSNWYMGTNPIISLARYDVGVLTSMTNQAMTQKAFTERQAGLICKIILKYRRQLATKGVDVTPVENPVWRVPLRKMDYSKSLRIEGDKIVLVFPYDQSSIDAVKAFSKTSQGTIMWNHEDKKWEAGLTEGNLSYLHTWAQQLGFDIDSEAKLLMDKILEVEKKGFKIELQVNDGSISISNAPESMLEYINTYEGGFTQDNLLHLLDMAPVFGYTIHPDLKQVAISEYGTRFYALLSNKELKINPATLETSDEFDTVIAYAEVCNRFPVVIYEPNLSGKMLAKLKGLNLYPVFENGQNKSPDIGPEVKFIHTTVPLRDAKTLPLVISSAGMVFGGDKQLMLNWAQKVVYCSNEVYNKGTNLKVYDIGKNSDSDTG